MGRVIERRDCIKLENLSGICVWFRWMMRIFKMNLYKSGDFSLIIAPMNKFTFNSIFHSLVLYVCLCACVCTGVCVGMYVIMNVQHWQIWPKPLSPETEGCLLTYIPTHVQTHARMHTYTHAQTHTPCTYIYTHIHTSIHIKDKDWCKWKLISVFIFWH